ncbi:hypothetical protein Tco_1439777 [Tanacetum coccineum]
MDLLLAEERFLKIKQAVEEEQNQPEAEQEEPAAQNFLINLNFPMDDDDEYTVIYRKPKEITPDLPIKEPDNSLNCSITSPKIDFLPEEFVGELDLIDLILPGIDFDEDDCDEADFDEEE